MTTTLWASLSWRGKTGKRHLHPPRRERQSPDWPRITRGPLGTARYAGSECVFVVEAAGGAGTLTYQWRKDGAPIEGATGPALTLNALTQTDQGIYSCLVADGRGTVLESAAAALEVFDRIHIDTQPYGGDYFIGESHTLDIAASGGRGALRYEWRHNGLPIPGETNLVYLVEPLASAHAGDYACTVRDSGADSRDSESVIVTVLRESP
jgi:hypothetical protein